MASKTQYIKLVGKGFWAHRLFIPDEYNGVSRWGVDLFMTGEELDKFRDLELTLRPITNSPLDNSYKGFRIRRPTEKDFGKGLQKLEPPQVLDSQGNIWPNETRIGNGTLMEVDIAVYGDGRYKGHRLNTVRILELVDYEAPTKVEGEVKTQVSPKIKTPW